MQIRNFNLFTFDDCTVVAYFFLTIVSNFIRDNHKLFVLAGKRMHVDTVLFSWGLINGQK